MICGPLPSPFGLRCIGDTLLRPAFLAGSFYGRFLLNEISLRSATTYYLISLIEIPSGEHDFHTPDAKLLSSLIAVG